MNIFEENPKMLDYIREAWKEWDPHYELIYAGNDAMVALFLLSDPSKEFQIYAASTGNADYSFELEATKKEFCKQIGADPASKIDPDDTDRANHSLKELILLYERKNYTSLPVLTFNYLIFSEWLALTEDQMWERKKHKAQAK